MIKHTLKSWLYSTILTVCYTISGQTLAASSTGGVQHVLDQIELPPGFVIELYSAAVPQARQMALGDDGTVYVGSLHAGKVYAIRDNDKDGKGERVTVVADGLTLPNGVAYRDGSLYIAEVPRISRIREVGKKLNETSRPEIIFDQFPSDLHHGWKYIRFGPDGKLYVPVGAPCNICEPRKPVYASMTRLNPDGKGFEIYAKGIRNSVGFDWHPQSGEMYFTDNGRDRLGDDVPSEELNRAPKFGLHFGYPYCHAGDIADPQFGKEGICENYTEPAWRFPAHVAALGIRFYTGSSFPAEYKHQLFVAQHGSWNRSTPQGYRIETVKFEDEKPKRSVIFAQGWLQKNGNVLGRPVDVMEMPDGSILVSDDHLGAIYRIRYGS